MCTGENSLVKASRGRLSCCVGTRTARCKEPRGKCRPRPTHAPRPHTSALFLPQKLRSRSSGEVGCLAGLRLDDPQCKGLGGDTPRPSQGAGTISASAEMTDFPEAWVCLARHRAGDKERQGRCT